MVILHVKRGDESLFLYETKLTNNVEDVVQSLVEIHNGCLKVLRLCSEIELLRDYGVTKPPEMHGLLEDQIKELKLTDDYKDICQPKGGFDENEDVCGKRTGECPKEDLKDVLSQTIAEARGIISKEQVKSGVSLTPRHIEDAILILRGGVEVVYPNNIPPYDPVRMEFENKEDLSGTQDEKKVLHPVMTQAWFAGKELQTGKKLSDYFGKNEKTKVVIKLQPRGSGAPGREPILSDEQKKALMMAEFKRREELKKLDEDEGFSYLDSDWADNLHLKKSLNGLKDVTWKPH